MKRLALGITALSLLLLAATAEAFPLPTPADKTIQPRTSLAGITLGESFFDAEAAWGQQGHCEHFQINSDCIYGEPLSAQGGAQFFCKDGDTVNDVSIFVGLRHGDWVFKGPLLNITTARGNVGLGDRLSKLLHAYPKFKKVSGLRYKLKGSGGSSMTVFVSSKNNGRITLF